MSERISRNWYESTARMVARSSPHGGQPPIKLALVYNHDISMFQLRKGLIEALLARGVDVWLVVPPGPFTPQLAALGAKLVLMPMPRFLSPARDLQLLYRLFRLFRREAFDVAFCITIKPNIWGTLAAWAARVPTRICLVPGAGFVFARGGHGAGTLVRNLTRGLCRIAYALSTKVIFQNHDDHRLFTKGRIAPPSRSVVVRSSGVDLCAFSMARVSAAELFALRAELGLRPETKCVLMVTARMIWSKGVREFVEAAAALAPEYPEWRFVLLAPQDPGTPDAVPTSYLEAHKSPNLVVIDRFRPDVLTFHALAEITVLPSFYPEGVPRSLLEAMALAKPIVTCDMPGCRETVVLGYNGYLIPPRDVSALIERLRTLMDDPELRRTLGRHSRALVGREFDERVVVAQTLAHIFGDDGPEAAEAVTWTGTVSAAEPDSPQPHPSVRGEPAPGAPLRHRRGAALGAPGLQRDLRPDLDRRPPRLPDAGPGPGRSARPEAHGRLSAEPCLRVVNRHTRKSASHRTVDPQDSADYYPKM